MTDSVSEKEEKDIDELEEEEKEKDCTEQQPNNEVGLPVKRRQKKQKEEPLPPGWERHEVR